MLILFGAASAVKRLVLQDGGIALPGFEVLDMHKALNALSGHGKRCCSMQADGIAAPPAGRHDLTSLHTLQSTVGLVLPPVAKLHLYRQVCHVADWSLVLLLELCILQRCWKGATCRRPLMCTASAL